MNHVLLENVGQLIQAIGKVKEALTDKGEALGFIFSFGDNDKGDTLDIAVLGVDKNDKVVPMFIDDALIGKRVEIRGKIRALEHEDKTVAIICLHKIRAVQDDYVPSYKKGTLQMSSEKEVIN